MKPRFFIFGATGLAILALIQFAQAIPATYVKGSDGSLSHQFKNPCKVTVKADPALAIRKTLYLEPRPYTFSIAAAAAAGWKIVSAKYKNSSGQDVVLFPPNQAAATFWQFSTSEIISFSNSKIVTVRFATLRITPSGHPDYEEDIVISANVVSNLSSLDVDGNGMSDLWETQNFGGVGQDPNGDPDHDGLSNLQEFRAGTNPKLKTDSDNDGIPDEWELRYFGNLTSATYDDPDGDGIPNIYEVYNGTNPIDPTSVPVGEATVDINGLSNNHRSIQDAINAVQRDYAVIYVRPGKYKEHLYLTGKKILLSGLRGSANTVILGQGDWQPIVSISTESIIQGFTITNGYYYEGGGVRLDGCNARVFNCILKGNTAYYGGAIASFGGSPLIAGCTLIQNKAWDSTAGIYQPSGTMRVRACIVRNAPGNSGASNIEISGTGQDVCFSDVRGNSPGIGNFDAEPALNIDGRLTKDSQACLGKGWKNKAAPSNDIDGEPRGAAPDVGADQFIDTDGDGLPDAWERQYFGNLSQTYNGNGDDDTLNNGTEYLRGTNPTRKDTDGDGMPDDWEIAYDLDPLSDDSAYDADSDGLNNLLEYLNNSNPRDPEDAKFPILAIASGNHQAAPPNRFLPLPLKVRLTTVSGAPLANYEISFMMSDADSLSPVKRRDWGTTYSYSGVTDANGFCSIYLRVGSAATSSNTVVCRVVNAYSVEAEFTASTSYTLPPAAATQVTVKFVSNKQLLIRWQDKSSDEALFIVERSEDGTHWDDIAILPPNTTEFLDHTPQERRYLYRVTSAYSLDYDN